MRNLRGWVLSGDPWVRSDLNFQDRGLQTKLDMDRPPATMDTDVLQIPS